ncbi:MAG: hypothetical protein AAGA28_18110 [Pseudomonadota bacterium]
MTDAPQSPPEFPCLSSAHAAMVIRQCADITMQVSDHYIVEDLHIAPEINASAIAHWVGKPLSDIVCDDSQSKLGLVVGDNCASLASEGRWHEMNFKTASGRSLPLQVKFFRKVLDDDHAHLLCARDLSAVGDATERFQRELTNYERRTSRTGPRRR